jgi:hypothetical protein
VAVDKDQWLKQAIDRKRAANQNDDWHVFKRARRNGDKALKLKNESLTAKTNAHMRAEKYRSTY